MALSVTLGIILYKHVIPTYTSCKIAWPYVNGKVSKNNKEIEGCVGFVYKHRRTSFSKLFFDMLGKYHKIITLKNEIVYDIVYGRTLKTNTPIGFIILKNNLIIEGKRSHICMIESILFLKKWLTLPSDIEVIKFNLRQIEQDIFVEDQLTIIIALINKHNPFCDVFEELNYINIPYERFHNSDTTKYIKYSNFVP